MRNWAIGFFAAFALLNLILQVTDTGKGGAIDVGRVLIAGVIPVVLLWAGWAIRSKWLEWRAWRGPSSGPGPDRSLPDSDHFPWEPPDKPAPSQASGLQPRAGARAVQALIWFLCLAAVAGLIFGTVRG